MKTFIKVNGFINSKGNKIAFAFALLVGLIRYFVCNEISCSVSYGLTTLLVAHLLLFIYKIIAKNIFQKALAKNPTQFINEVLNGGMANPTNNKTDAEEVVVITETAEKGENNKKL